jgi:hypothetical protein
VLVAGAGAVGGTEVVLVATGATETGSEMVGCAYAPNTTMLGAIVLGVFFFFLVDFGDEEF